MHRRLGRAHVRRMAVRLRMAEMRASVMRWHARGGRGLLMARHVERRCAARASRRWVSSGRAGWWSRTREQMSGDGTRTQVATTARAKLQRERSAVRHVSRSWALGCGRRACARREANLRGNKQKAGWPQYWAPSARHRHRADGGWQV